MRLARLRIQAGIEAGDDITLGSSIAADAAITDEMIQREIDTLGQVIKARPAAEPRVARRDLVPQAARTVPSMAPTAASQGDGTTHSEEALVATAMAVSDEESLFE
jgi:hypothetical protein